MNTPEAPSKKKDHVIRTASGDKYKNKAACMQVLKKRDDIDASDYVPVGDDTNGWELILISYLPELLKGKEKPVGTRVSKKYQEVEFLTSGDSRFSRKVELFVNGSGLLIERNKRVIIPMEFVECADHTRFKEPGDAKDENGRAMMVERWVYPFNIIRSDVPEEEYLEFIKNNK